MRVIVFAPLVVPEEGIFGAPIPWSRSIWPGPRTEFTSLVTRVVKCDLIVVACADVKVPAVTAASL